MVLSCSSLLRFSKLSNNSWLADGKSISRGKFFDLAVNAVPGWSSIANVKINQMKNALSNKVYLLEADENTACDAPKHALLRIYGKNMDSIIEKEKEVELSVLLSRNSIGPKIYCIFPSGRLEEYIESDILDANSMRTNVNLQKVAVKMAEFHRWNPISNEKESASGELWERIDTWFEKAVKILPSLSERQQYQLKSIGFPSMFQSAYFQLRQRLFHLPDSFIHADLQYGNILISKATQNAVFIDFEYALNAPAQFDVANYWCEWAADYSNGHEALFDWNCMPSQSQQKEFVARYFQERGVNITNNDIHQFIEECHDFESVSHLHWALWGLLKEEKDGDFDYFAYAMNRLCRIKIE